MPEIAILYISVQLNEFFTHQRRGQKKTGKAKRSPLSPDFLPLQQENQKIWG
jgi:hypothetical protein